MAVTDIRIHPNQTSRVGSYGGIRVREDSLYTNHKGQPSKSARRRAENSLEKLREPLSKILEPDEVVLHIARAQAPAGLLEQLTFGFYIYIVTRTALVLTDRRLLHFLVEKDGTWKRSLRRVWWGDVEEARIKGWLLGPGLWLRYRNGKQESYWGLKGNEAKKVSFILSALLPRSLIEATATRQMVSLCPACHTELRQGIYRCGQCGLRFKDESTMRRRALSLPGGGYFYVGLWPMGIGTLLVEIVLLAAVVIAIMIAAGFPPPILGGILPPATWWQALLAAAVLALVLALEKQFALSHCRLVIGFLIPEGKRAKAAR